MWRPSTGEWYIDDGVTPAKVWGDAGDVPVPGDWNGDGRTERAVFRPSTGHWYIDAANGALNAPNLGRVGDRPVPGDYLGEGRMRQVIYRPQGQEWIFSEGRRPPYWPGSITFPGSGGIPVPGSFGGNRLLEPAVWTPSTGQFASVSGFKSTIGGNGDIPLPALPWL